LTYSTTRRRFGTATVSVAATLGSLGSVMAQTRPALAYNCVNVVLRDPYWGQFRRIIESGSNAAGVASSLARAGFVVNGEPSVGAVMSWPPGQYGASSVGHVGVVAGVNGNGTVLVRHENWPYGSPEHLQNFAIRPGMQFVHVPSAAPAAPAAAPASTVEPVADEEA
jgi:surface antigen